MAVATKYITTELIPELCGDCGLTFGMPDGLYQARLKDGKVWYCPLGHPRHYTERRTLKEELEQVRGLLASERAYVGEVLARNETTKHQLRGTKAALTRTKRRANAGVCLDCKRSFANVRAHRAKMHPEATP